MSRDACGAKLLRACFWWGGGYGTIIAGHVAKWGWDPADQVQESKTAPARKVKKESPEESPGSLRGVPAGAPKRVKNESPESKNR